ncbi:MAG TPA: sulfotransferase [Caulobacteraceae bacterium]|nr:sulfotransferase [Caulobacteraceae bacterium]
MNAANTRRSGLQSARRDPLAPEALAAGLREAAALRVAGRYDEASALYLEIERRNPEAIDAAYFLVLMDLARDRPAEALPRAERLARRAPKTPNVWHALAHTHGQLGQWREAVAAFERVAALDPDRAPGEYASALETMGRIDDAAAIYRRLAERPSTRSAGLVGLARLYPGEVGVVGIGDLERVAGEGAPLEARIPALYALGGALEAKGEDDRAFAAFAAGSALKRKTLTGELAAPPRPLIGPPERAAHPDEVAADRDRAARFTQSVFTADFIRANEGRGHHIAAPIFVVGMPRSGSTLIEQILSSHRAVQGLGESGALARVLDGRYPDDLFAPNPPGHFRDLAEAYFKAQHARGWKSAPRFVDKTLGNAMSVGMIHLMLPNAVVLNSVRDAVDTCLGCFRQLFASGNEDTYDLSDIGHAYVRYRAIMAHWAEVLPGRVIDVSHEALIADPPNQIRWLVTEACGLDWDEACLSFHQTRRPVRTASVAQVRRPIFTTGAGRWRRYERHLGPLFEALGPYAPPRG